MITYYTDKERSAMFRIRNGIKIDIWMGGDGFESDQFTIPKKAED